MRELGVFLAAAMMFAAVIGLCGFINELSKQQAEIDARLASMEEALGIGETPEEFSARTAAAFDAIDKALSEAFPSDE